MFSLHLSIQYIIGIHYTDLIDAIENLDLCVKRFTS